MKTEQLQPGQGALALGAAPQSAELNAGGQTSHGENTRGGSAMYLRGLAEGEHGTSQFGAAPQVEHAGGQAEMGGGEPVGPVENHFRTVRMDKIQGFIADQQGNNLPNTSPIKLPDGTTISFGEYKKIAAAIQETQAKGDRRPIEEIVREARQPAPRPPEPQPAPRSVDWRDSLPQDQRKRLDGFENRIANFSDQELQFVEAGIREARAKALKDGWNHKSVQEGDVDICLRLIQEKLVGQGGLESMLIENGLYDHIKLVQQQMGLKDLQDTLLHLAGKLGYHESLLENSPPDLFPPAAMMPNGEWDATGEKLVQFLRKLTTGNKLNNGG